jgi:glycosyltransferase involved in cell wall biosynthesis
MPVEGLAHPVMTAPAEPLVSVVTPVYNGGKWLRECIESVIAQHYQNWRYTIVNNCSTDDTREIAESYARRDPRLRLHDNVDFLPIIDNHNNAVALIDPDSVYCKPLMADDWLYPDCLEEMVRCAVADPSIGLVCCLARAIDQRILYDRLRRPDAPVPTERTLLSGRDAARIPLLEDRHFFGSPTTMLIRSDLIRKRRPFYDTLNLHADAESCYDVLQESDFAFVHKPLTFVREHDGSHTASVQGLQSMFAGRVYALTRYGHVYLTEQEFQRRLTEMMAEYYAKLAVAAVERRDSAFWDFHRAMLMRIGAPLDKRRLARAVARHVARKATAPRAILRGLARLAGRKPGARAH